MTAERRTLPYPPSEIRDRLQRGLWGVLDKLKLQDDRAGVKASGDGRRIYPLNPMRADTKAGSFVIWTAGDAPGAWKDYATGDKGDIFDLVQGVERLADWIDAYWWALDHLNLDRKGDGRGPRQAADVEIDRRRRERDRLAAEAKQAEDGERKSARLFAWWLTLAPIAGTLAQAYLREGRRIPLERLAHAPGALRFAPALDHIDEATGEVTTWPAMVAAMTRGVKLAALHRTWLAPDGLGKAPVAPAKKMIGPTRGSAIRLSSGPSGLSPTKAAAAGRRGPLAIGEGIETSLTVAAARPDYRVWAAGSLSLMGLLEWPDCASAVVLLRDNDWKAEAQAAFAKVERHWRDQAKGRPVVVAASAAGSDFNDWAREAG